MCKRVFRFQRSCLGGAEETTPLAVVSEESPQRDVGRRQACDVEASGNPERASFLDEGIRLLPKPWRPPDVGRSEPLRALQSPLTCPGPRSHKQDRTSFGWEYTLEGMLPEGDSRWRTRPRTPTRRRKIAASDKSFCRAACLYKQVRLLGFGPQAYPAPLADPPKKNSMFHPGLLKFNPGPHRVDRGGVAPPVRSRLGGPRGLPGTARHL